MLKGSFIDRRNIRICNQFLSGPNRVVVISCSDFDPTRKELLCQLADLSPLIEEGEVSSGFAASKLRLVH